MEVKDAASRMGISARRVRELIANGEISASKFAGAWDIDPLEVSRIPLVSKPLTSTNALLFSQFAQQRNLVQLSPGKRKRFIEMENRIRNHENPVTLIFSWLANRAERVKLVGTSDDLYAARADKRLILSGVNSSQSQITAPHDLEGYLLRQDYNSFIFDHCLLLPDTKKSNAVLHIVREMPLEIPLFYVIADLAQYGKGREFEASRELLDRWKSQ